MIDISKQVQAGMAKNAGDAVEPLGGLGCVRLAPRNVYFKPSSSQASHVNTQSNLRTAANTESKAHQHGRDKSAHLIVRR